MPLTNLWVPATICWVPAVNRWVAISIPLVVRWSYSKKNGLLWTRKKMKRYEYIYWVLDHIAWCKLTLVARARVEIDSERETASLVSIPLL